LPSIRSASFRGAAIALSLNERADVSRHLGQQQTHRQISQADTDCDCQDERETYDD
jgi:hypothetical protein